MTILDRFQLDGKTAIITGGNRGIGKAITRGLAEAGANTVIANRDSKEGRSVAADIADQTSTQAISIPTDIQEENQVEQLISQTVTEFGGIDILVNNAGVSNWKPAEEMTIAEWNEVVRINLTGLFLCSKHAANAMIPNRGGSIINISSMSAFVANHPQNQAAYNASKGGVVSLTSQLASEWAEHDIRVNSIAPGYIRTDMIEEVFDSHPELAEAWLDETLLDDIGDPDDVVGTAVLLASGASSYITGETILIDGGYTVR